jgi:hypothetical protein
MTKKEFQELVREAVRGEVAPLEERMAAREGLLDEALEMTHVHEVRIAALEDDYNKAMKDMGSFRVSNNHAPVPSGTVTRSRSASPPAPPSPFEPSSRASGHHHDESDDDSIYGGEDYESPPQEPSPPHQAHEVSSPQLDKETSDELAELGGWGLDDKAFEDVSDGNSTDQDAEGETDDEYEAPAPAPPISTTSEQFVQLPGIGRPAFKPLSRCKTKGAPARHE